MAQHRLGQLYACGTGVEKNIEKAAELFRKSAEQGNPDAQLLFGCYLYKGRGIKQDKARGVQWIKKSAERGNSQAQYLCGLFAQYDKNSEAALRWFKKSAAQGNEGAIKALKELGEELK